MEKVRAFFLTALCGANFFGQVGTIAVLKYPLSQEFGFRESDLGIFDVAVQVGNLLGNIFLLFVILNRPKRFFFLTIVFQSILMLGMLTGKWIPDSLTLHSFIIIMFLFGLTKAVWFLPNVLLAEYFDSERDKFWVGIWSTILWMGDPMTIFLYSLLTDTLKLQWEIYIIIISSITFLLVTLWQIFLKQVSPNGAEKEDILQQIKHIGQQLIRVFSITKYTLLIIDFSLKATFYYNILLWFPYYFTALNFPFEASLISIVFPIFTIIGSYIFELAMLKYEPWSGVAANFCLGLSVVVSIIMLYYGTLEQTSEIMKIYIFLSAIQGFFAGGPSCRLNQKDIASITEGNSTDLYVILSILGIIVSILLIISLYCIGYFLERDNSSMFIIILINISLFLITDIAMRFYVSFQNKDQQSQQKIDD